MYNLQHYHPVHGWLTTATSYTKYCDAEKDRIAGMKHTGKHFKIIPMQLTIPTNHRSHKEKVRDYLLTGGTIHIFNMYGILGEGCSLAARIKNLRDEGMQIDAVPYTTHSNGKDRTVSAYSMSKDAIVAYGEVEARKALTIYKTASETLKKQLQSPVQTKEAA